MAVDDARGDVAHLGHVELLTPDLAASRRCFVEVLGMREVGTAGDSLLLRGESEYERSGLTLSPGPAPGIGHLGLRTRSAAALERRVAALRAAGVEGIWHENGPGHGPAFAFDGGGGHRIELYWETERYVPPADEAPPAKDRLARRGSAGVDVRRLDHVNLLAPDVAPAARIAREQLGDAARRDPRRRGRHGRRVHELRAAPAGARLHARPAPGARPTAPRRVLGRHARGGAARGRHLRRRRGRDRGAAGPAHDRPFILPVRVRARRQPDRDHHGADLVLDPDPPVRTWTAAERRAGVGWGTRFPPTWTSYATPDLAEPE